MKSFNSKNQKGLIKSAINSALCTKQLHSAGSNSAFCILHSAFKPLRSLLLLTVAIMVSGQMWGRGGYAYAWPNTSSTKKGSSLATGEIKCGVYVSVQGGTPSSDGDFYQYDSSEKYGKGSSYFEARCIAGYSFVGWYTNKSYSSLKSTNNPYTQDLGTLEGCTLFAKFAANTYTITFNANYSGGTNGSATATFDGALSNISHCTRTYYSLNGYYTATSGGTKVVDASGNLQANVSGYTDANGKWVKAGTATLYAHWTPQYYGKANAYQTPSNSGYVWVGQATTTIPNDFSTREDHTGTQTSTGTQQQNFNFVAKSDNGYQFVGWYNGDTKVSDGDASKNYLYSGPFTITSQNSSSPTQVNLTAHFHPSEVTSVNSPSISFNKAEAKTATVTFNVAYADAVADFNYSSSGDGWTFDNWTYNNNQVSCTAHYTATTSTSKGAHTGTVTLTSKGNSSSTKTATVTANVDLTPTLTYKNGSVAISLDESAQKVTLDLTTLKTAYSGDGTISYALKTPNSNVVISGSTFYSKVAGNFVVVATASAVSYYQKSAEFTVTVTKRKPTVSWTPTDPSAVHFVEGETITANAGISQVNLSVAAENEPYISCSGNTATILGYKDANAIVLKATTVENDQYSQFDTTTNVYITNLFKQVITWNQPALAKLKTTDATKKIKLTATDNNTPSRASEITYAISGNQTGVTLTHESDGWYINYSNQACKNTFVTASLAGVQGVSIAATPVQLPIKVINPNDKCDVNEVVVDSTSVVNGEIHYNISTPETFNFQAKRIKSGIYAHALYVYFYDGENATGNEVASKTCTASEVSSTSSWTSYSLSASDLGNNKDIKSVKFETDATKGFDIQKANYNHYTYCNGFPAKLDFETYAATPVADQSFTINYANYQVELSIDDNSNFSITTETSFGDCGTYGSKTVTVHYKTPSVATVESSTLYIKDNSGTTLGTVTLNANVIGGIEQKITKHNIKSSYNTTERVEMTAETDYGLSNFTFTPSSTDIATVEGNIMTFKKSGTINLTIYEPGNATYLETSKTIENITVNKATPTITPPTAAAITYGQPLSASTLTGGVAQVNLRGKDTEIPGTWAWTEKDAIKTANNGTAKEYEVTFTPNDGGMYNAAKCSVSVLINRTTQTITWNDDFSGVEFNQTKDLHATASGVQSGSAPGAITYSLSSDLATIDNTNKKITFNKGVSLTDNVTLTAKAAATADYNEATATKQFTIAKGTPTISWKSGPFNINNTYTPAQLFSVPNGDANLYSITSSTNDNVAIVSGGNLVTRSKEGESSTITVSAAGNDNWQSKTFTNDISLTHPSNRVTFEVVESMLDNSDIFVEKSGTVSWKNEGGTNNYKYLRLGNASNDDRQTNYVVIKFYGVPKDVTFDFSTSDANGSPTWALYESTSKENFGNTTIWASTDNSKSWKNSNKPTIALQPTTRYLKFFYFGKNAGDYMGITVTKLETFATSPESLDFGVNKKEADCASQTVTLNYASVGHKVTLSTNDSHFTVSPTIITNIGGDQAGSTSITVKYSTTEEHKSNDAKLTITDELGHKTEVALIGETQGSLHTTTSWTGESSYVYGTELNNLFQAKDDNGNVISGGTWKLESDNTDAIQIVDGKIKMVCGNQSATITGTLQATSDYQSSFATATISVTRKADAVDWSKYERDGEGGTKEIHFWAYDPRTITDVASSHTKMYYGPGETWADGVITFTSAADGFAIGKHGSVLISTTSAGDCEWDQASSTHTIIVDPCSHSIVWDQTFLSNTASKEGVIDKTIDLTAYAVDSMNSPTNVKITYSIADGNIAELTSEGKLHIKGVGETTIIATTASSDKYATAIEKRTIKVRKEGEACGSNLLNKPSKISCGATASTAASPTEYAITGPAKMFSFDAWRYGRGSIGTVTISGVKADGNIVSFNIDATTLPTDESESTHYSHDITGMDIVKFQFSGDGWINSYVKNVLVTQKSYFYTSKADSTIIENVAVNDSVKRDITLYYSDVPVVQYNITNNSGMGFTLTPTTDINNDCGQVGSFTFKLSGICTKAVNGAEETITLSTSAGDKIEIPFTITATLGDTYTFLNGAGDSIWENKANWKIGESTPTELPGASNAVTIKKRMVISSQVECYSLSLVDNAAITIMPTGGLTVHAGGVTGLKSDNFRIKSTTESQGYFRMSPEATTAMPNATVEYATKSDVGAGNKEAVWQYFGIPTADNYSFYVDYITWVCEWNETTVGWIPLHQLESSALEPFHGYIITGYDNQIRDFAGQLYKGDKEIILTNTAKGMKGDNVIANSYAAPIDVTKFTNDDFKGTGIDRTFYLMQSGSYNDWQENIKNKTITTDDVSKLSPGQYLALPALSLKDLGTNVTTIAPMQGVYMYTSAEGADTLILNYRKHVWSATATNLNRPMNAPERAIESVDPDTLRQRVRLSLVNTESGADILYLIEREKYTPEYDNGYDANKIIVDNMVNIYTNEQAGNMAVSAINDIDSMYVGFTNGAGDTLTMYASLIVGEPMYLLDTHTETRTLLTEGASYTFTAEPNTRDDFRFMLLKQSHSGDDPIYTGWINKDAAPDAHIWNTRDMLYVTEAGAHSHLYLYSMNGQLIDSQSFSDHTSMSIVSLPKGCYMARVGRTIYKFVR